MLCSTGIPQNRLAAVCWVWCARSTIVHSQHCADNVLPPPPPPHTHTHLCLALALSLSLSLSLPRSLSPNLSRSLSFSPFSISLLPVGLESPESKTAPLIATLRCVRAFGQLICCQVHVHELSFDECPKSYVFRGNKEIDSVQVAQLLGLFQFAVTVQSNKVSRTKFTACHG
jgi:hypothetical protein